MASAGTVSGTLSLTATFSEYVTSSITPYTIAETLSAFGVNAPATLQFNNGTASGQINLLYAAPLSLAGSPQTLNLQSCTDPGGGSIVFARVRFFMVYNAAATAGYDLKIYPGATNPWAVLPGSSSNPNWARYGGGIFMKVDYTSTGSSNGDVVTSGSCQVTCDPGANTFTAYVLVAGGTAA